MQANCPICDDPLDCDPDGGYCERCREYFDIDTLEEYMNENVPPEIDERESLSDRDTGHLTDYFR